MQHQRILFFSAYASWHYHTLIELSLANALRHRGAEVRVLACDGLFPICDVHRKNLNPRTENSCNACQASTARSMSEMRADYRWLSRYVPAGVHASAAAWAAALPVEALPGARWDGRPVGEWALSSSMYQERRARPDWSDPDFAATFRQQLHATVLAFEAARAACDEFQPDLLITQNGRFFAQRAAVEVARERKLRFVTHERGMLKDTLTWHENELKHELEGDRRLWAAAAAKPLEPAQVDFVQQVLHERRFGKGLSWSVQYSPPPEERRALLAKLALDARPIVALFTSSEDEQASFPGWAAGAFQEGSEWLEATVELARATPSHQFVIRMHPALVSMGVNVSAVEHARGLKERLPENCRVVMPQDDVSSYTLADAAELGIVYYTTMGLEMAARGQRVLCVAAGWYAHAGFARFVERREDYAAAVRQALGHAPDLEVARRALRFAWQAFGVWSLPFTAVIEHPMHRGKPTFKNLAELKPGRNADLDHLCAFLLEGVPLFPPPERPATAEELALESERIGTSLLGLASAAAPSPALPAACNDNLDLILKAEAFFAAGEATAACEILLRVLEKDPRATRAWKDLGAILHSTGHRGDAEAALEQALRIDPDDDDARTDLELVRGQR